MADTTLQSATCRSSIRTFTGWTVIFMVLLRIAIGWHFFYEGAWKLLQPDWRATSYLTASSGPLRPVFRWMVWDVDGLKRMTKGNITDRIDEKCKLLIRHYEFDEDIFKSALNLSSFSSMRKMEMKQRQYKTSEQFHTREGGIFKFR